MQLSIRTKQIDSSIIKNILTLFENQINSSNYYKYIKFYTFSRWLTDSEDAVEYALDFDNMKEPLARFDVLASSKGLKIDSLLRALISLLSYYYRMSDKDRNVKLKINAPLATGLMLVAILENPWKREVLQTFIAQSEIDNINQLFQRMNDTNPQRS